MTEAELATALAARLDAFEGRLGDALRPAFGALRAARHMTGAELTTLFHPAAQPLAGVPLWVHEALGGAGDAREALVDLGESAICGYLRVRLLDDLIDEGEGEPATVALLGGTLLLRHVQLLQRWAPSERMARLVSAAWSDHAEAVLLERRLVADRGDTTERQWEQILSQGRPLALAGAALLDRADRWDLLPALETLVFECVRSGQVLNDFGDALADYAAGRQTWVVKQLAGDGGGLSILAAYMTGGPALLGPVLDDSLTRAVEAADALGSRGAAVFLANRRELAAERLGAPELPG